MVSQILPSHCYCNASDYTIYLPAATSRIGRKDPVERQLQGWIGPPYGFSYDCGSRWNHGGREISGPRLLACKCYQGRYWSLTFRGRQKATPTDISWGGSVRPFDNPEERIRESGYEPDAPDKDWKGGFLFPVFNVVKMLTLKLGLQSDPPKHGLVVIAGATKSSKTLIARGVINEYLKILAKFANERHEKSDSDCPKVDLTDVGCNQCGKHKGAVRRPHLVTFEDPIEKWFWKPGDGTLSGPTSNCPIDYTPRERRLDVGALSDALGDALRQTPSVFYIGEIRNEQDWAPVIEFAGTGHLVVATAHGGSLTETIVKICRALKADTPAQRNYVANRIRGVVHLRLMESLASTSPDRPKQNKALIGSLWRRTVSGIHALTSGGFSSLLPANPKLNSDDKDEYCFGHSWWGEQQLELLDSPPDGGRKFSWDGNGCRDQKAFRAKFRGRLLDMDIREE